MRHPHRGTASARKRIAPEIFDWLLARGADANARASINRDGFGGHTPLLNAIVCGVWHRTTMTRALLERATDDPGSRWEGRAASRPCDSDSGKHAIGAQRIPPRTRNSSADRPRLTADDGSFRIGSLKHGVSGQSRGTRAMP
jgi:hypothetical protein